MTDEAKALVEQWRSAIDALPEPWGAFKLSAVKILDLVETQAREIERLGVIAGGNARLVCKVLDEKDAEIERLNTILSEMNDTDVIARTMAENKRLRAALEKAKYWIGDLGPAHVLNKERSAILFAFLRELEAL